MTYVYALSLCCLYVHFFGIFFAHASGAVAHAGTCKPVLDIGSSACSLSMNSGGSNSLWSEFWSEFPHFMGMGVVPAPSINCLPNRAILPLHYKIGISFSSFKVAPAMRGIERGTFRAHKNLRRKKSSVAARVGAQTLALQGWTSSRSLEAPLTCPLLCSLDREGAV